MTNPMKRATKTLLFILLLLTFVIMTVAMRPPGPLEVGLIMIIIFAIPLYFLPTIIAALRHSVNKMVVFLVNLFLGWSVIGWIIALILSLVDGSRKGKNQQTVIVSQNVGGQQKDDKYLGTVKERYAKGEISKEEFEQLKKDLS